MIEVPQSVALRATMTLETEDPRPSKPKFRCRARGKLGQWLAQSGGSLAITTYTSGRLVLVSCVGGRVKYRMMKFARPMGFACEGDQLAMAVREQLLLFRRAKKNSQSFLLERCFDTGKLDIHDVVFGTRGVYFANTKYNCVARPSEKKRFVHHWQPPFLEGIVRADRCHLNGIGIHQGRPQFATAFCATGKKGDWREHDRFAGGVVIDIPTGEVVVTGLCMPHSPRRHQGQWWLCNSGEGSLSMFNPDSGRCDEVCQLPGFTRGLCFVNNHALVGLSRIREKHILDAPPVRERHSELYAGLALVDLKTGNQTGGLEFLDGGREVYEVMFLPGVQRPQLKLPKDQPSQ